MNNNNVNLNAGMVRCVPSLRDILSVCFRHRQLIVVTFCAIFVGSVFHVLITPRTYEAETEILVKRERADPVVTPETNTTPVLTTGISEEDLNSEVELLKSRDLLEKVVIACGLDRPHDESVIESLFHRVWRKQGDKRTRTPACGPKVSERS